MSSPMLILASRSPRRARLLRDAGLAYVQTEPPFCDPPQPEANHVDGRAMTMALAREKALSLAVMGIIAAGGAHAGGVILSADTVCINADGRLCGQPESREQAEAMLRGFFDRPHQVITGVAILGPDEREPECFSDAATVLMHTIHEAQFQTYLDTNQWQGKAGGYNLFDRQRAHWPIDVDGDPATVVGLPMRELLPRLARRGIGPAGGAR